MIAQNAEDSKCQSTDATEQHTEESVVDQHVYIQGFALALVLGALTLTYFLVMLDNTILATAIPYITDDFHSLLDIGWYGSAYQLSCAALIPMLGKGYSRLNSKWLFLGCLFVFEAGSIICGVAYSSRMLIVGRAIAGIGGSGLINGVLILANSCIPPHKQPLIIGTLMSLGQLGIAAGPLIGGGFTQYVTWRWCFYLNLPIGGMIIAGLVFISVPDHLSKPPFRYAFTNAVEEFDLVGVSLFAPATVMFFLALQYGGNQYAWNSSQVIGLFCGAGITFILWLEWNRRAGDAAMAPFSILTQHIVWTGTICGTFLAGTIFVTAYYLPIYFQAVQARTPFQSGIDVLPSILAQMVFGIIGGGAIQMTAHYTPFMIFGAILNSIGCGLLSLLIVQTSAAKWIGYQVIFGAGRGLANAVPFLAIQNSLPKDKIPAAMSILAFTQNLSAAVMIVAAQTIFTNSLTSSISQYAPGVSASAIIRAGSTGFMSVVPSGSLDGVLKAYAQSLDRVWYFCGAIATPSFFFALVMGRQTMRKVPGGVVSRRTSFSNVQLDPIEASAGASSASVRD